MWFCLEWELSRKGICNACMGNHMEEFEKIETEEKEVKEEVTASGEIQARISPRDIAGGIIEDLTAIMCAAIFILVPLYMKNKYFGIGTGKYVVYRNIMFICLPLLVCFGIWYLFCIRGEIKRGWLKAHLSIVDKAMILYLLCVFISFFLSDFKAEAVWGYEGWYMGLLSQISFVLLYFFVSRFGSHGEELLVLLCCVSLVVYVLGILNRFLIDPLGVYAEIDAKYQLEFLSTLGQSSWYSSFLCTVLPIGIYFFWSADTLWKSVLSGIYCVIGFSTLVTQNSDSAFIALACMLLALLCFSVKDGEKMTRFYWVVLFFLGATRLMNLCTSILNTQVIEQLETFSYFLIKSPVLWGVIGVNIMLILIQKYLNKKEKYSIRAGIIARNVILGIVILVLLLSILCLYLSGTGKLPESIARITNQIPYLTWNDMWGNRRGFSWRVTWQIFKEMKPMDKLFGVGPECYSYYAYSRYKDVLDTMFQGLVLSNAHNEWYNAVINYGVVGGVAYLGIFASALKKFVRSEVPVCKVGATLCLFAYVGHNFFCYQQVLCTPFIFTLLGFFGWFTRKAENKMEAYE